MTTTITPAVIAAIHASLRDFGYASLTLDYVKEQVDKIIAGEAPPNIIAKFARNMLQKGGYLPEEA